MTIHTASTQACAPRTPETPSRRGSISILSAVAAMVLVGVVGLGLDTALVMTARQQLQRSADAAALAAAAKVKLPGQTDAGYLRTRQAAIETAAATSNDIIRCGTAGIVLDPNLDNSDDDTNQIGDIVVGRWRFNTDTNQFFFERSDPANRWLPVPDAVKVRAQCASGSLNSSLELFFGYIFGTTHSNVGRSAIARKGSPDDPLIIILDPHTRWALLLGGSVIMDVQAGTVQVDSDHPTAAFRVNGSVGVLHAQRTRVVGNADLTVPTNLTGDLIEGSPYVPDPLASLPEPSTVGMTNYGGITGPGTYDPGYYPDGIDMNGGVARLNPGIYVIGRNEPAGGIDLAGDAFLDGDGILLFLEPEAEVKTGGNGAGMRLTPALSGTYYGVTIFQARTSTKGSTIGGGGVFDVRGTYYIPNGKMDMHGDVTRTVGRIIVYTLEVHGNATYTITGDDLPPPTGPEFVFLVK